MPSLKISCFQLSLAETDNLDKATKNINTFFIKKGVKLLKRIL